jgi:hypothetical protein
MEKKSYTLTTLANIFTILFIILMFLTLIISIILSVKYIEELIKSDRNKKN